MKKNAFGYTWVEADIRHIAQPRTKAMCARICVELVPLPLFLVGRFIGRDRAAWEPNN